MICKGRAQRVAHYLSSFSTASLVASGAFDYRVSLLCIAFSLSRKVPQAKKEATLWTAIFLMEVSLQDD